jgi:hypothetical protein
MCWMQLAQDRDKWRVLLNMTLKLAVTTIHYDSPSGLRTPPNSGHDDQRYDSVLSCCDHCITLGLVIDK